MTEFVFTHGNYRVRIKPQEGASHPWSSHSQASQLFCWHEDADFSGEDIEQKHRHVPCEEFTPEQALEYYNHLSSRGRPFVFTGLLADKYGFITTTVDPVGYSGALVLPEEQFKQFVDSKPMSDEEMYNRMKEVVLHEFEMLRSYLGGEIYYYIIEVDNTQLRVHEPDLYGELKPFESGIDTLDSMCGFYCINGNYQEMFQDMVNNFPDEVPVEIKNQMKGE